MRARLSQTILDNAAEGIRNKLLVLSNRNPFSKTQPKYRALLLVFRALLLTLAAAGAARLAPAMQGWRGRSPGAPGAKSRRRWRWVCARRTTSSGRRHAPWMRCWRCTSRADAAAGAAGTMSAASLSSHKPIQETELMHQYARLFSILTSGRLHLQMGRSARPRWSERSGADDRRDAWLSGLSHVSRMRVGGDPGGRVRFSAVFARPYGRGMLRELFQPHGDALGRIPCWWLRMQGDARLPRDARAGSLEHR